MSIAGTLRQWLSKRSGPLVIQECRNCGTTLSDDGLECPNCGSSSVARYEVP